MCYHSNKGSAEVPAVDQALVELLGIGASQRMFRKFIESSYITLDPKEQILEATSV